MRYVKWNVICACEVKLKTALTRWNIVHCACSKGFDSESAVPLVYIQD